MAGTRVARSPGPCRARPPAPGSGAWKPRGSADRIPRALPSAFLLRQAESRPRSGPDRHPPSFSFIAVVKENSFFLSNSHKSPGPESGWPGLGRIPLNPSLSSQAWNRRQVRLGFSPACVWGEVGVLAQAFPSQKTVCGGTGSVRERSDITQAKTTAVLCSWKYSDSFFIAKKKRKKERLPEGSSPLKRQ